MKKIYKRRWFLAGLIAFILIAGLLSYERINDLYVKSQLEPLVELNESINNMLELKSYRYSLDSGFTIDQRKEVISRVAGEKQGGNTHIKGEMVNTEIDIYYIDRTIYNYDATSDKWLVIESSSQNSAELLISELNPLSNFPLKETGLVEKQGFEKVNGTECLVVKCEPGLENQLLETLWCNFEYVIWIDYKDRWINKAVLNAENKQSPGTMLRIEAQFSDFNEKISIVPPDITAKKK